MIYINNYDNIMICQGSVRQISQVLHSYSQLWYM